MILLNINLRNGLSLGEINLMKRIFIAFMLSHLATYAYTQDNILDHPEWMGMIWGD